MVGTDARVALVTFALLSFACGGSVVAGPSPVTAPPTVEAVASRPLPAGLDPAYVRTLVTLDGDYPQKWEGGFSHCGAVDEALAAEVSAISGQPQNSGPCNVEWVRIATAGHSYTELHGTARTIVFARIFLYNDNSARTARHEMGHVLGLNHSSHASDLMAPTPSAETFTADELAILAWMYDRR